jgi:hypothetical protein
MIKWKELLGIGRSSGPFADNPEPMDKLILGADQQESLQSDIEILDDDDRSREEQLHKEATKAVQDAAENSLRKLHVIQMGRCPVCGEHLRRHMFASICEACGWHTFDVPRKGPVRVHMKDGREVVEGDRCYVVKTGFALIVRNDVVVAKIPKESYDYVEYVWSQDEVEQRHRGMLEQVNIVCAWCATDTDPGKDGFHVVQVAFGSVQERHCFCSDDCYEAFRKMYPARVHRDCYNRRCSECNLCVKQFDDDASDLWKDRRYANKKG